MPATIAPGTYLASFMIVYTDRGPAGQAANQITMRVTVDSPKSEDTIRDYVVGLALKKHKATGCAHSVRGWHLARA